MSTETSTGYNKLCEIIQCVTCLCFTCELFVIQHKLRVQIRPIAYFGFDKINNELFYFFFTTAHVNFKVNWFGEYFMTIV